MEGRYDPSLSLILALSGGERTYHVSRPPCQLYTGDELDPSNWNQRPTPGAAHGMALAHIHHINPLSLCRCSFAFEFTLSIVIAHQFVPSVPLPSHRKPSPLPSPAPSSPLSLSSPHPAAINRDPPPWRETTRRCVTTSTTTTTSRRMPPPAWRRILRHRRRTVQTTG